MQKRTVERAHLEVSDGDQKSVADGRVDSRDGGL